MDSSIGVKNLKTLICGMSQLGSVLGTAMSDGEIGVNDLMRLPDVFLALSKLVSIDINMLPIESADLDAVEKEELLAILDKEFDIPLDTKEKKIELVLHIAVDLVYNLKTLLDLLKK